MTVTETGKPVCKADGVAVDVRMNFVVLVNVICTCLPCRVVTIKLLLLTSRIVPIDTAGQIVFVVGVDAVELLVLAALLLLPQATSSAASSTTGTAANNFLIIYLLKAFLLISSTDISQAVTIQVSLLLSRLRRRGGGERRGTPRTPPRGLAGPLEPPAE